MVVVVAVVVYHCSIAVFYHCYHLSGPKNL